MCHFCNFIYLYIILFIWGGFVSWAQGYYLESSGGTGGKRWQAGSDSRQHASVPDVGPRAGHGPPRSGSRWGGAGGCSPVLIAPPLSPTASKCSRKKDPGDTIWTPMPSTPRSSQRFKEVAFRSKRGARNSLIHRQMVQWVSGAGGRSSPATWSAPGQMCGGQRKTVNCTAERSACPDPRAGTWMKPTCAAQLRPLASRLLRAMAMPFAAWLTLLVAEGGRRETGGPLVRWCAQLSVTFLTKWKMSLRETHFAQMCANLAQFKKMSLKMEKKHR